MLVRFVESYPRAGVLRLPGELLDVDVEEAKVLVEAGVAVPVAARELELAERR